MRTVAFINLKGGVGKTVSAANFAHILTAVHHKRVLLVDGDKQGNASQYFELYGSQDGTAALLTKQDTDIMSTIYQTQYKGLDVITSNMDLYSADRELWADEERGHTGDLKDALRRAAADYDYCVIDNGPSIDVITLNILVAADDVLIPVRPDDFSLAGMVDLLEQIGNVKMLNPGRGRPWRKAGFARCSRRRSPTIRKCPRARLNICRCACSPGEAGRLSSTRS